MKLLALVLLLSTFSSLALTEVVKNFITCNSSFIHPNPKKQNDFITPTIFKDHPYKMICQRLNKEYRFATLYDTTRRIPVYSAYTYLKKEKTKYENVWNIEPQLDNIRVPNGADVTEMMRSPIKEDIVNMIINQAVEKDYNDARSNYTRGHVFPRSFAAVQDQADSTFTLTNIAPQTNDDNQDWAKHVETPMLINITKNCRLEQDHQAYIVTGVVPGNRWISITRDQDYEKGINVPSYFWSAFCCTSKTDINKRIGMAYIAKLRMTFKSRALTIGELNKKLTKLYRKFTQMNNFSVFPGLPVEDIIPPF